MGPDSSCGLSTAVGSSRRSPKIAWFSGTGWGALDWLPTLDARGEAGDGVLARREEPEGDRGEDVSVFSDAPRRSSVMPCREMCLRPRFEALAGAWVDSAVETASTLICRTAIVMVTDPDVSPEVLAKEASVASSLRLVLDILTVRRSTMRCRYAARNAGRPNPVPVPSALSSLASLIMESSMGRDWDK